MSHLIARTMLITCVTNHITKVHFCQLIIFWQVLLRTYVKAIIPLIDWFILQLCRFFAQSGI